jgi:hypothetical protein
MVALWSGNNVGQSQGNEKRHLQYTLWQTKYKWGNVEYYKYSASPITKQNVDTKLNQEFPCNSSIQQEEITLQ